jgi:outer membrane protein OmpA-like peptidoglycan-associated protein
LNPRKRGLIFATLSAVLATMAPLITSCGPKNVDVSAPKAGRSLVVLLPDADGSVGRANVSNKSGTTDLAAAYAATQATAKRRPSPASELSEQEVKQIFGEALSALPAAPKHFSLYFKFESDELTEESRALISDIQQEVKARLLPDIVIVGHTDTMGTPLANFDLGLKRAAMVRTLLREAGLDASTMDVTSLGEADLLIKTPDETPEPRNRRVEIAVR